MISLLLWISLVPNEFGVSPLVEDGHQHVWREATSDSDGQTWVDSAWSGELKVEQSSYPIILIRTVSDLDGDPTNFDQLLVADCKQGRLGIQKAWVFNSFAGNGYAPSILDIDMNYGGVPMSDHGKRLLSIACADGQ